jgi:hypothetical protein
MTKITRANSQKIIDYLARDYDSILLSMRELVPVKFKEWKDYQSEADFGNVLLQLFAHMGDILSYYQDRVANESFLGTARNRRSIIQHLSLIGYRLSTAAPSATKLKITVPADYEEFVEISRGDAFATKSHKDKPSIRFEYTHTDPLKIDFSDENVFRRDPKTNKKYFMGIPVEEGRLISNEILGASDGTPNQTFSLVHESLILKPISTSENNQAGIELYVGDEKEPWNLQKTLAFSRDEQKDYVIEVDEDDRATIVFGDGDFGAIPPKGAEIKATYRVGGGAQGNVSKESITTIVEAPQLALIGAKVTNPEPATGGANRESIERAVMHAPQVFRSLNRAVTLEDYEALALELKGVGKVRAEPASFNTVILYIAPEGGGYVSDVLKKDLLAHFEDKRPVSTIIKIEDVDYVNIYVAAEVDVERYYSRNDIEEQVVKAGAELLAFENVEFAQVLYLSKFYETIEAIEGVQGVNIVEFRRDNPVKAAGKKQGLTVPAGYRISDLYELDSYFRKISSEKFHQPIREFLGLPDIKIETLLRRGLIGEKVEPTGKIALRSFEIPKVPDKADYSGGIKVDP